jgi:membrane fusion protein, multidrug efflux system
MNNKIIKLAVLSAVVILAACGGAKETDTQKLLKLKGELQAKKDEIAKLEAKLNVGKKDSIKAIPVEAISIMPTVFTNYIDVQGKVDADNNMVASPEMPGVIQSVNVSLGQFVNKGQVVATLKANIMNDGIAELEQQIQFAKTLYDKQKRLWDQEIGTEVQLLAAKNNYDALVKKRTTLSTQKSMYNIVAPISGVVDAVDIKAGSAVSPGMPIGIRIVSNSNLKAKMGIAENYGSRVNGGDQVMLIFPDINDTMITRVGYVTKVIDPITRTFTAEVPIPANAKVRPNMIVKARVVGYTNNRAIVLNAGLIQKINGADYVYIVDEQDKAKLVQVKLGESYMGKVEVLGGLQLGNKLIINGYNDLNDGDKVSVQNSAM